jgi:choline kinase/phosphohistidine swiveling domain-containing protein
MTPARHQVAILGAGRGLRGSRSSAMIDIDGTGRVMDWLLAAFGVLGDPDVSFVGGYQADQVIERYSQVRPVFNRDWRTTGPVQSLALVPLDLDRELFACYADVVFRPAAVAALRDAGGDVVLAIDSHWRRRYDGRGRAALEKAEKIRLAGGRITEIGTGIAVAEADAEFAGVLRLSVTGVRALSGLLAAGALPPTATMPDLIRRLIGCDLRVTTVDLEGQWAELDAQQDLARFVLGTKAESLSRLSGMDHGGHIGPMVAFTIADWGGRRDALIAQILDRLPGRELIVRSSAGTEDGWSESGAGRHASIAPVERTAAAIEAAVAAVIDSYGRRHPDDQVLVQELLRDVAASGVVMTRAAAIGAPYYVLNFDDRSPDVGAVTSGSDARAVFLHRDTRPRPELPAPLGDVLDTAHRIEQLVGYDSLDIEFAVTRDGRVHVLQVRPIAVTRVPEPMDDDQTSAALAEARRLLIERQPPPPPLVGRTTRYSVMADWNPAEIIGTKPKRLSLSLYRHLITNDVWARQRAEYGFRDVRPCPLLVEIAGHPYVDVRASFSSFIPATIGDALAGRLVDTCIERLAARPALHDKVEFDVAFTCLTADFDARAAERLTPSGFTDREIGELRDALRLVTERGIERTAADHAGLAGIDTAIAGVLATPLSPLDQAAHLLDVARRGTLAFAHLARSAFVATSLLRSFGVTGALTREDIDGFLGSIETVFGQIRNDGRRVRDGELSWEAYVERYGHLRPGTYDITAPCYCADAEHYLRPLVDRLGEVRGVRVSDAPVWNADRRRAVADALRRIGLTPDVDRFETFARLAIAGREEGKFVFTRALSAALECLAAYGASEGLTRADLAHVPIHDLLTGRDAAADRSQMLERRVEEGRDAYRIAQAVCLPGQIARPEDLVCFEQEAAEPNFITQRAVEGPVVVAPLPDADVRGRIVLVPSADPGHDWLLARDIAGLITMYGGANSHMAVRAAEAGLPAAIGAGERIYAALEPAIAVRLDCAARMITVVHS